MDDERTVRPVLAFRVVLVCGLAGFLLDILDHSYAVFSRGLPVTFTNLASASGRPWHGWAWLVCGCVCGVVGAFVVGQVVELWVGQRRDHIYD